MLVCITAILAIIGEEIYCTEDDGNFLRHLASFKHFNDHIGEPGETKSSVPVTRDTSITVIMQRKPDPAGPGTKECGGS
jgi:hypothetical protein